MDVYGNIEKVMGVKVGTIVGGNDMDEKTLMTQAEDRMKKVIDAYKKDLASMRAGQATFAPGKGSCRLLWDSHTNKPGRLDWSRSSGDPCGSALGQETPWKHRESNSEIRSGSNACKRWKCNRGELEFLHFQNRRQEELVESLKKRLRR